MIFATNKKIRDFHILETLEAGISLLGPEVKAIRSKNISIDEAFIKIKNGEVYIINMNITPISSNSFFGRFDPLRHRKLLLRKHEIKRLIGKIEEKGITVIPTKVYDKNGWIKIEIAIVKHKTQYDKREEIKRKEIEKKIREIMKRKGLR
ncbi:MAG: SsrA-binding protein SmpB [Candidatus Calescibacterium sp.]|nr:SsrA-binding protein SmpB [Candidatus Calescibacterium sp.]MCX7971863.1 SsrA-binding protein SmpB [bacterium]MDW8195038.1 SsrA-binding protein SmpB [Candidatus Calescibacterium sp.]